MSKLITLITFILLFSTFIVSADEGFPGREKFPDIPYISMEKLYNDYKNNKYLIIDVRSKFEFNVIHIIGAVNIPFSDAQEFEHNIKILAKETDKAFVFYCNGRRCMRSFKAARASKLKPSQMFVFDSGVFEWSVAYPDDSILLGESSFDKDRLISSKKLNKHFLPLKKFEEKIPGSILIDIRDPKQRAGSGLFLLADKFVPLDRTKKLERYLNMAKKENKTLLAYDNTGKQVRWLQYHIEKKNIKNYYFMKGGAKLYTY